MLAAMRRQRRRESTVPKRMYNPTSLYEIQHTGKKLGFINYKNKEE